MLIRADDLPKISNSLSCSALVVIPLIGQLSPFKYIVSSIRAHSRVGNHSILGHIEPLRVYYTIR